LIETFIWFVEMPVASRLFHLSPDLLEI